MLLVSRFLLVITLTVQVPIVEFFHWERSWRDRVTRGVIPLFNYVKSGEWGLK